MTLNRKIENVDDIRDEKVIFKQERSVLKWDPP